MLLVYSPKVTNRIGYIFNLIFKNILNCEFEMTTDSDLFEKHDGAKLCYAKSKNTDNCVFVKSDELLFQHSITDVELRCFEYDGVPAFFGNHDDNADIPFDMFAASFYLVSRYEEYMPFRTNEFGCFSSQESFALKHNFLHKPVIDIWARRLATIINQRFPQWEIPQHYFNFISTVKIGQAYKYKRLGILRTIYGYCHDMGKRDWRQVKERTQVLLSRTPDPYDRYEQIVMLTRKYHHKILFWSLMCNYSPYDHNISYRNNHLRYMLKHLADYGKVGLSLSYETTGHLENKEKEAQRLADVLHKPVIRGRFNYNRFFLPNDYKDLIDIGIEKDYSMGFHDQTGFRAGTCTPFHFFNLDSNSETNLLVYPTPVPDSIFYKLTPDEAWETIKSVITDINAVGGTFVSTWKLDYFTNEKITEIYENIMALCKELKDNNQLKNNSL